MVKLSGGNRKTEVYQLRSKSSHNLAEIEAFDENDDFGFVDTQIHELREWQREQEEPEKMAEHKFNAIMGGVIIVNIAWMAIEIDFGPEDGAPVTDRIGWIFGSTLFQIAFFIEVVVRARKERWKWFRGVWNWFDAFVLLLGIIDVWILSFVEGTDANMQALSALRMARLIRLIRMIKLVRNLHGVYTYVMAFTRAIKGLSVMMVVVFFGILIYSIFGTMVIGRNSLFDDIVIRGDTIEDRFGKVSRSFYSLFEIMTLEGWEEVSRPLVERNGLTFLFFASFLFIFSFGMVNMVVANVVQMTVEESRCMKEVQKKQSMLDIFSELAAMRHVFDEGDESGITAEEFKQRLCDNPEMASKMVDLGMNLRDVEELFQVLDWNENGRITMKELLTGVGKIQSETVSNWNFMASYAGVRSMRQDLGRILSYSCPVTDCDSIVPDGMQNSQTGPESKDTDDDLIIASLLKKQNNLQQGLEKRLDAKDEALNKLLTLVKSHAKLGAARGA